MPGRATGWAWAPPEARGEGGLGLLEVRVRASGRSLRGEIAEEAAIGPVEGGRVLRQ